METFACPYCNQNGFTEDELWSHCPRYHGDENVTKVCPICAKRNKDVHEKGDVYYGFSSHLHYKHGPPSRRTNKEIEQEERSMNMPTYSFALVVVQHPVTQKFVLVEECCKQGYWLPGGRVDPGETFQEAAVRETIEEAGLEIELKGILRVEYSPFAKGGARQRIIFYAHPTDLNNFTLKTTPDFESLKAVWISYDEMMDQLSQKKIHLRGNEPFEFFSYVQQGLPIHPIQLLGKEGDKKSWLPVKK